MASIQRLGSSGSRNTNSNGWGILSGYYNTDFLSTDRNKNIALAMNDGTSDLAHKEAWTKFDRFYSIDTVTENPSTKHYIFICRPDLFLVEEGSTALKLSKESRVNKDPYFNYLAQFHPHIISSLTGEFAGQNVARTSKAAAADSGYGNSRNQDNTKVISNGGSPVNLTLHAFIPFLSGRVESIQLPDYTIKQNTMVQPYTKYSVPYTTSAIESCTGGSFDLTFREDEEYSIHKMFYAWIYYQNCVMRNIFKPKEKYIMYNAFDYATSIYDFLVDHTGENILYFAKYTGCIPTSVPMSDLSFNKGGSPETSVTIPFAYYVCEHMDFNILMDFNYNSLGYIAMNGPFSARKLYPFPIENTIPIYDQNTFLGRNLVGRPVVFCGRQKNGNSFLKLRWLP